MRPAQTGKVLVNTSAKGLARSETNDIPLFQM